MTSEEVTTEEEEQSFYEHYRFDVDPGQEIIRIDKFLVDKLPNTSRHKIQLAARAGNILVNTKQVKPNHKIRPKDVISVVLPYPRQEMELLPEDIPLDVVYEDDDLMLVNKPAGLVVHPGTGNFTGTLVNALLHHFDQLPVKGEYSDRPGLVHRLDKDTTGLMVVAKKEIALNFLAKQFFDRTTDRRYLALVWGDIPGEEGEIEGHIGRSNKDRKVMAVYPEGDYGKAALTRYKVLERFGYVTLVECKLETGRTHQIRAHFKYIGFPLFGDPTYGGNKILKGTTFSKYKQFIHNCFEILPRQALHARSLDFDHPTTKERMSFDSEMPEDMRKVMEKWRVYVKNSREL